MIPQECGKREPFYFPLIWLFNKLRWLASLICPFDNLCEFICTFFHHQPQTQERGLLDEQSNSINVIIFQITKMFLLQYKLIAIFHFFFKTICRNQKKTTNPTSSCYEIMVLAKCQFVFHFPFSRHYE